MSKTAGLGTPAAEGEDRGYYGGEKRLMTFWVVTAPTINSLLGDICFETDANGLARQVLGGLKPEEILGVFTGPQIARAFAVDQFTAAADRLQNEATELEAKARELRRRGGDLQRAGDRASGRAPAPDARD